MEPLAVEGDLEIAAFQAFANCIHLFLWRGGDVGRIGPAIPEHYGAATVLTFGDRALEGVVIDRVILDLHRKSFYRRVEARAFWHRPTLHDPVELEAEIEVEMTRGVLLDHETQSAGERRRDWFLSGWLVCSCEVALFPILGELSASARLGAVS